MTVLKAKLAVFLLVSLYPFCVVSQDWAEEILPADALKAIELFRYDPVGDDADAALSVVGNFAERSSKVLVELRPDYFPWTLGQIDPDDEAKFVGAFVAGNVEYQLVNNIRENRPLEGVKLTLFTYQKLRDASVIEALTGFEDWLELERRGELDSLFED